MAWLFVSKVKWPPTNKEPERYEWGSRPYYSKQGRYDRGSWHRYERSILTTNVTSHERGSKAPPTATAPQAQIGLQACPARRSGGERELSGEREPVR